jgi:hypothetical protein
MPNCCDDKKKKCGKCVDKYVIHCLPKEITKPGEYCLAKDFTWSDPTKSAITIKNTENVVLNFNQRKITTDVASAHPLVLVDNVTDVQLLNVHLQAVGAGKYSRGGISIQNSILNARNRNILLESAILLNLDGQDDSVTNNALVCVNTDGLEVTELYLKNDKDSVRTNGIYFDSIISLIFRDSKIYNARTLCQNSQNTDFLRLHINNTGSSSTSGLQIAVATFSQFFKLFFIFAKNVRVADCNINVTNGAFGISIATLTGGLDEYFFISDVVIENNIVSGTDKVYLISFEAVNSGIIRGNSCNFMTGDDTDSSIYVISLFSARGITVSQNNIFIKSDYSTVHPQIGIYGIIVGTTDRHIKIPSSANLISENNIYKSNNILIPGLTSFYDVGIGFRDMLKSGLVKYNTVERNNVSGFQYGITDGDFDAVGSDIGLRAICNIYSNNFSNGNGQNYLVITPLNFPPGTSIFLPNNVDGCVDPSLAPVLIASLAKSEERAKRLTLEQDM